MGVTAPAMLKAKTLFQPIGASNAVALGVVSSAALSATRQSYTAGTISYWNTAGRWNTQGQKWAAITAGSGPAGVQNRATGRSFLEITWMHHICEVETVFTGEKLDIQVWGSSTGFDVAVWIEHGGRMIRLTQYPLGGATSEMRYLNIMFAQPYHGRIRVHVGAGAFVGFGHEQSAILTPAPNRPYCILDGDSYVEGQQAQNAGGAELAYFTANVAMHLFEATGFVFGQRAQGGTGFFQNAANPVTDDSWGLLASTRWFSAHRRAWMTNLGPPPYDFALPVGQKPLFFILNGTWNDGTASGGQTPMYARAKECYQWVVGQDPYITMVHVLCEPYWGNGSGGYGAAGTPTGPPTVGNAHHLNVLGQLQALAEVPRCYAINPFGPDNPWWTGKGDYTTLATDTGSQQAKLTGSDHIHGNYAGYRHYAHRIARELGEIAVPAGRAQGLI